MKGGAKKRDGGRERMDAVNSVLFTRVKLEEIKQIKRNKCNLC